jgi:hypothetical protein
MIVWLASYPRSGNTLLRTVLFKTMGLESASDEVGEKKVVGLTDAARHNTGIAEIEGDWDEYCQNATQSSEVFLVKTHRPPRDNQPAIYIVRDGRKASLSYSRFHQRFTPKPHPSLLDLILGGDYYGGWSDHYRTWIGRANTLLIRYEDLVDAKKELLEKLAETVRYTGEIAPWHNPFDQLHQENPDFFRKGETTWQGDSTWTPMINAVFFHLHGDLMIELGYASPKTVAEATREIPGEWFELVEASRRFLAGKKALETICDERQAVINGLKSACDERLALIEKLSKSGK